MKFAQRSAIITTGALVLPLTRLGMTDASHMRRPSTPRTLRSGVTTVLTSVAAPMRHVPTGWYTVFARLRTYDSSSAVDNSGVLDGASSAQISFESDGALRIFRASCTPRT